MASGEALTQAWSVARFVARHPANRGRRGRALARAAAFQLNGRLLRLPTLVAVGEHSWMVGELHSSGSSIVAYANPHDWNEIEAWKQILRPGDRFVDVGANVGAYAMWACELGAEVIAVEPNELAVQRLRRNAALNGYDLEIHEVALGAEPGTARFDGGSDTTGHLSDQGDRTVEVSTLDAVLGDRTVRGIKIDVEGFERLVLEGGHQALSEGRIEHLQLEWNDCSSTNLGETRDATEELLRSLGYELGRPDETGRLVPDARPRIGADLFAWRRATAS